MAVPNYQFMVDGAYQRYGNWLFGYWVDIANAISIQASMQPAPGAPLVLSALRVQDVERLPSPAVAFYQLRNDGRIRERLSLATSDLGKWIDGNVPEGLFEARMVHLNGDAFNGPPSWVDLGQNQEWGVLRTTVGITRAVGRIEIRATGTTTVLAQARIVARARVRP